MMFVMFWGIKILPWVRQAKNDVTRTRAMIIVYFCTNVRTLVFVILLLLLCCGISGKDARHDLLLGRFRLIEFTDDLPLVEHIDPVAHAQDLRKF